jgi:hypothetical protein
MLKFEELEEGCWIAPSCFGAMWQVANQGRCWSVDGPTLNVEYVRECATLEDAIAACNAAEKEQERLHEMVRQREFLEVCAYQDRFGRV